MREAVELRERAPRRRVAFAERIPGRTAALIVDDFTVTDGYCDEGVADQMAYFQEVDFDLIKISDKASNVPLMVEAYRQLHTYELRGTGGRIQVEKGFTVQPDDAVQDFFGVDGDEPIELWAWTTAGRVLRPDRVVEGEHDRRIGPPRRQ